MYMSKEIDVYFRNVYVKSDIGLFNEQMLTERCIKYSYDKESVLFDQNFLKMVI